MEAVYEVAGEILLSIALAVTSLAGAWGSYYICKAAQKVREQTRQLKDSQARDAAQSALDSLERIALVTVEAFEQTTAGEVRQLVKEGLAAPEELLALARQAKQEIRETVAPQVKQVLEGELGGTVGLERYLQNLVEAKVLELKQASCQHGQRI